MKHIANNSNINKKLLYIHKVCCITFIFISKYLMLLHFLNTLCLKFSPFFLIKIFLPEQCSQGQLYVLTQSIYPNDE